MTDLQRFKELYLSLGIALQEERHDETSVVIELGQSVTPQFTGYGGCCSLVYFTNEGKFIEQGFWE